MNFPFLRRRPTPADLPPVRVPTPATKPAPTPPFAVADPPHTQDDFAPTPLAGPGPAFEPGRYTVTYDRNVGPLTLTPLTVVATSAADLTEQIRTDLESWHGTRIEVTVDTLVSGGMVRAADLRGTFTYTRGGGAR